MLALLPPPCPPAMLCFHQSTTLDSPSRSGMVGPLLHQLGMKGFLAPSPGCHTYPVLCFQGSTPLDGASIPVLQGSSYRGQGSTKLTVTVAPPYTWLPWSQMGCFSPDAAWPLSWYARLATTAPTLCFGGSAPSNTLLARAPIGYRLGSRQAASMMANTTPK